MKQKKEFNARFGLRASRGLRASFGLLATRRLFWPLGTLALLVLLLAGGWIVAAGQAPAPALSAAADPDQTFIQGLRQALRDNKLNASDRQALQKKLSYNERLAAQRGAKPAAPGPKGRLVVPVPMPLELSPGEPEESIRPGSEGMLHAWEASVNNRWEGLYQGTPYQVFAGSAADNPAQGLVVLIEYPAGTGQPIRRAYPAPGASGALTILERQASRLRCAAADGSSLFFDLETREFQP